MVSQQSSSLLSGSLEIIFYMKTLLDIKEYMHCQPDLLCIEYKSPANIYRVSEAQKEMKKRYVDNGYAYILSNNYDKITKAIHEYMGGIRVPSCKYCEKIFHSKETRKTHYKVITRAIMTLGYQPN